MEEYTAELAIHAELLADNLVEPQQHTVLVRRCGAAGPRARLVLATCNCCWIRDRSTS